MAYIAVAGAANVDIGGFAGGGLLRGDSNPGRVRVSMGGVGRNIACCAARLGLKTELVTALGNDRNAELVAADCAAAGVSLAFARRFPEEATSTYLYIADSGGDMVLAINDMAIHDRMTPELFAPLTDMLCGARAVVLDANLPAETLRYLAENVSAPLIADAVSAVKAGRLRQALPRLAAFKPNRLEAEALTGIAVRDEASARAAARKLTEMGARTVYLTLSTRGVCVAGPRGTAFLPGVPMRLVSATGAGDAFTAGLAWARCEGLDEGEAALAGMAAASIAVESAETVNPAMTRPLLEERMEWIRKQTGGILQWT